MARRVLVIDDEPRILEIVTYYLERGGHEVEAFTRPDEGVEAARKRLFDVAVLDLVLGARTSGYDVAGRLKKLKNSENLPVLFMSSKVEMSGLFLESFDGRAEFVLKPFKKETLLAKVDALLEGGGREARRAPAPRRR